VDLDGISMARSLHADSKELSSHHYSDMATLTRIAFIVLGT
jgi:hypothetical protein